MVSTQRLSVILVPSGIPQGSALDPLLFLVYINEMPSLVTHSRLLQFVDDTTLICPVEIHAAVREQLCFDLQKIQTWITSIKMKLNVGKSSVMWFARKCASRVIPPAILVDDHQLKEVDEEKFLGITFDKHFAMGSSVRKSVQFGITLLKFTRKSVSYGVLMMLIKSLCFTCLGSSS